MDAVGGSKGVRFACDAMCGGLARWLRACGVDASFQHGIDDDELLRHALAESRVVVSSDGSLFDRKLFRTGEVKGLRLPVGLLLQVQVELVFREFRLRVGFPRCTRCNGELHPVGRDEVCDVVPARSLVWAKEFFRCDECGHVFWEGTHWRRIGAVRRRLEKLADEADGVASTAIGK